MTDRYSFNNIESFLLQCALQTQELSQKKNEINQQIKICRADIAERRSYTETLNRNIKNLEEEIRVKQSNVTYNKANAKSMKATNYQLLQYEQTLKEELESRKASYNHDMEVYEERIGSYRKIFQLHKEYYCQNPLAQKLLTLQAEKEEIELRIEACDDQITMKQKELDHLTSPAVKSFYVEKPPDSVSGQQHTTEPEKQVDLQTEEDHESSIDISALHLSHTKNGHEMSVEANVEENIQAVSTCRPSPEEASNNELWLCQQLDEQGWQDVIHTEEQNKGTGSENQEQQSSSSVIEDTVEEGEKGIRVVTEEDQESEKDDNEELTALSQSSPQERNPQPSPTRKAVPSAPTFTFNFSPSGSPHHGTSDTKSPAFLFSLNSEASTAGFSGFDLGSSQDEDSSFTFTGPFFNEKKTTKSKSSGCPEFLFGQPGQSRDFQFAFTSDSPQPTDEHNTRDEFPFSFNF